MSGYLWMQINMRHTFNRIVEFATSAEKARLERFSLITDSSRLVNVLFVDVSRTDNERRCRNGRVEQCFVDYTVDILQY